MSDQIIKDIEKQYGEGIALAGQSLLEEQAKIISLSPSLNIILGGGVPEGSWVTLTGKPKCGKTTTALHFASKCQRPENGLRRVFYLNIEGRLKKMNLLGIEGLNLSPELFSVISSTEDKILSAQDFLSIGEKILLTCRQCVLIIDSFSSLCHEKELTDGIGTSTRGGGALLLAQFCRQMANVVPVKKSIVIGITHQMANTSGYGAGLVEKGGNAIAYQVDIKLKAKSIEPWVVGTETNGKRIGQKVNWLCEVSALGPPGGEVESCIRYGKGIDELTELITFATDMGFISKAGTWLTCEFMKDNLLLLGATEWNEESKKKCKAQGVENMYQMLKANPAWMKALDKQLAAVLIGR